MAENVTIFGDVADKFDALVTYDEKLLNNWVEEGGYSTGSMVAASTAMAFMSFAKGFVDVGRLGNGILIEGGWKGVGTDVLRALNLAGGAGAVAGRGAKILRLVQAGNTCTWYATTNAVRLSGQRFFMTVEQLAQRAGVNLQAIARTGSSSANIQSMITALRNMGVPVRVLARGAAMSLDDVLRLVRANPGGVVTFGIQAGRAGGMSHRLFATWSRLGGLVIRDPNSRFAIFRSVAELEAEFGAGTTVTASEVMHIANSLLTTLSSGAETLGGLTGLVQQVLPIVTVQAHDIETALQTLLIHEDAKGAEPEWHPLQAAPVRLTSSAVKTHTVVRGDTLSKLAGHFYGNIWKWPAIYAANLKVIGRDPNLIKPGQILTIPNLPRAVPVAARDVPGHVRYV